MKNTIYNLYRKIIQKYIIIINLKLVKPDGIEARSVGDIPA